MFTTAIELADAVALLDREGLTRLAAAWTDYRRDALAIAVEAALDPAFGQLHEAWRKGDLRVERSFEEMSEEVEAVERGELAVTIAEIVRGQPLGIRARVPLHATQRQMTEAIADARKRELEAAAAVLDTDREAADAYRMAATGALVLLLRDILSPGVVAAIDEMVSIAIAGPEAATDLSFDLELPTVIEMPALDQ